MGRRDASSIRCRTIARLAVVRGLATRIVEDLMGNRGTKMRLFTAGIIIGLLLGTIATVSAQYVGKDGWDAGGDTDASRLFHLGYVAGVIDTVQALKRVSFATRQTVIEALDAVDKCTHSLVLRDATQREEHVLSKVSSTDNAASIVLGDLITCK